MEFSNESSLPSKDAANSSSSHSVGRFASVKANRYNISDDPYVCIPSDPDVPLPKSFIPYLCDTVPAGSKSWIGVCCSPFWDFSAAEMFVFFFVLFFYRMWGRHEILKGKRMMAEKKTKDKAQKVYIREDLEKKSLSELMEMAIQCGVKQDPKNPHRLLNDAEPKRAFVEAILSKQGENDNPVVGKILSNGSAWNAATAPFLRTESLAARTKRRHSMHPSVSAPTIYERQFSDPEMQRNPQREELGLKTLGELKRLGQEQHGVTDEEIAVVDDEEDPKKEMMKIILKKEEEFSSEPTMSRQRSVPKGRGRRCRKACTHCCCEFCKALTGCFKAVFFCTRNTVFALSRCTKEAIKSVLLQVFQWWVLMLMMLGYCMWGELITLRNVHHVSTRRNDDGYYVLDMPDIDGLPKWLASFALYSYVALLAVYFLSLLGIVLQVLTHLTSRLIGCKFIFQERAAMVSLPRDVAIQVLLLPMVYSFLAAKCVSCMLSKMNHKAMPALECWHWTRHQTEQLQDEVYAANFALADMYEAWALYCFGQMVAKVMQPELRKKIRLDVFRAFEDLLLIDVSVFVFVAACGAVFTISLTWCKWRLGIDICGDYFPFVCNLQSYLNGANWCVSSIAIYNMYTIERKFENLEKMAEFNPGWKFWSVKLMVLVAFWAALVMAIIRDWWGLTEEQGMMLDASFRIYVMLIVAMMNLKAWWPWSKWYSTVRMAEDDNVAKALQRDMEENSGLPYHHRLSSGGIGEKNVPPGTVALMKRLFNVSEEDARDELCVERAVESLSEGCLYRVLHTGSQIGWVTPAESTSKGDEKRPMLDLPFNDRKMALMRHLQSFYPSH